MSGVLGADPADLAAVEQIVRAAGTSFYRGMAVLPPARRHAMYAIYAFCRIVDDIADDETTPFAARRPLLHDWHRRIAALFRGEADDPVTRVLCRAVPEFTLREPDFHAVIDGMEMDAEAAIVAPDMPTLLLYCDRVAGAVGRLSVRAFGDASAQADVVALHLGRALQLTNILRDIAEDAGRGRLYLPREWLDAAGVAHDPLAARTHPGLPAVCRRMAAQAQSEFDQARAAMALCDRTAMKPARLMGATYAAILAGLNRRGWQDLDRKVKLGRWTKIGILLRHLLG